MFFTKSRSDKEADARQNLLKELQRQFDEAQQCAEVGEKYLKLEQVRGRVDELDKGLKEKIQAEAIEKGQRMFYGTFGAGTTVGVLAFVGLHFPPLFIIAGPALGYYYGHRAGNDVAATAQDKALAASKPFFDALEAQRARISGVTEEIERSRLQEIAKSPRYEEIIRQVPRLRDQFAAAFGKQLAAEGQNPPPPKNPAPGEHGFKL